MDFNLSFQDASWLIYNDPNNTMPEPVSFEDFKFNFGVNPDFNATPHIGDFSSPIIRNNAPTSFNPLCLQHEATHTVLDENDQKAFSSFLDAFFLDPDTQMDLNDDDDRQQEETRRNSILKSLDEQKELQQTLNLIASLPPTNLMMENPSSSSSVNKDMMTSSKSEDDTQLQTIYLHSSDDATNSGFCKQYDRPYHAKKRTSSCVESALSSKKTKTTKELLTEEEKRANHIASEQKRRTTIRNGFQDLTDLVPMLRDINNSKSTVLFKAVDFIRHLEKRNKRLRDKVGSLELRAKVEGRMTNSEASQQYQSSAFNPDTPTPQINANASLPEIQFAIPLSPSIENNNIQRMRSDSSTSTSSSNTTLSSSSSSSSSGHLMKGLPANARNALLAHKTQQKQLLVFQEQLQIHQRLIAQQQEMKENSVHQQHRQQTSRTPKNKLPPLLGQQYESSRQSLHLKELEDKSISTP